MSEPIGYLHHDAGAAGPAVLCPECTKKQQHGAISRLYREIVEPYKQSCHGCGKTLVEPRTPAWPELYD